MSIKILSLAIYLFLNQSCGTVTINDQSDKMIYNPIVDSGGKLHDYKKSVKFELYNDYGLFCIVHYKWETISVRYAKKDSTGQLNRTEYIVRIIN